jgi:hypothetical protein
VPTNQVDLVYLAALVDTEGHISIYERSRRAVTIGVCNTHEPVMRWLESLGGTNYCVSGRDPSHKPIWRWQLQRRRDVLAMLEAIRPYMRIKGERADEAIAFLRSFGI